MQLTNRELIYLARVEIVYGTLMGFDDSHRIKEECSDDR